MFTTDKFTKDKLLKAPIKLIGAKTNNHGRDLIYQLAPPHLKYRELFMGSGGILVGKSKVPHEAINDIDTAAVNFYRQFQKNPKELFDRIMAEVGKIQAAPTGYYWKYMRDREVEWSQNPINHAVWYYCINKYAMNGIVRRRQSDGKCNSSWCKTVKGRGILTESWAKAIYLRIADVLFFNSDYREFVSADYDDSTFLVADPPYHDVLTLYSGIKFTAEDQRELKEVLVGSGARWLLTINDHPFIRELYEGFEMLEWKPFYSCSQTAAGRQKTPELIITNYPTKDKYQEILSKISTNEEKAAI